MGLVDYSDSDASDEEKAIPAPIARPAASKPTFQKVVDRSNPGKIKVTLPQISRKDEEAKDDEPPTKRAKIGGGGMSGFMSSLPAPKRAAQATNVTPGAGNTARKGGLGAGVNLKTGAAPAFSREPEPERDYHDYNAEETSGLGLSPPETTLHDQKRVEEVKLVGKPMMFKPLSVSRKPAKKKKATAAVIESVSAVSSTSTMPATPQVQQKPARPKVSMFSLSMETENSAELATNGEYKPMIYALPDEVEELQEDNLDASYEEYTPNTSFVAPPAVFTPPTSQSLDDIAGDLNLSAAERRQLFGRAKRDGRATNVINFNTDQEYLHNEGLRAAGEQVAHNPVRAIAAGKHSLKQLVNSAQSQKEALEESFAKGKSNRAEASSKYGW
jgi:hypothetical protein